MQFSPIINQKLIHMSSTSSISSTTAETSPKVQKFIKDITSPMKQWLFLFAKLPAALFMGVRVRKVSTESVTVTLPYKWLSQNPFKSTYFAAQAAAAEMSTGVLGMMATQGHGKVSMLVVGMEAEFVKKANKRATFICNDGQKVFAAVQKAVETGEGQTIKMESIGTVPNPDGGAPIVISRFYFTWSFKPKRKK